MLGGVGLLIGCEILLGVLELLFPLETINRMAPISGKRAAINFSFVSFTCLISAVAMTNVLLIILLDQVLYLIL